MRKCFFALSIAILLIAGCSNTSEQRTENTQPRSGAVPQRNSDTLRTLPSQAAQYPRQTETSTSETSSVPSAPGSLPDGEEATFLQSAEGQAELALLPDDLAARIEQIGETNVDGDICGEVDEACLELVRNLCWEASDISDLLRDRTDQSPKIAQRMRLAQNFYCHYARFLAAYTTFAEQCENSGTGTPLECSEHSGVMCETANVMAETLEEMAGIDPERVDADIVEGFREAGTLICAAYVIHALEAEDIEPEQTETP